HRLAGWLFHRDDLAHIFGWLVVALPAMSLNSILLAILNGKKNISTYVLSIVIGSLFSLALTSALAAGFGIQGALVAIALSPAVSIFASAALISRKRWFKPNQLWGPVDSAAAVELSKFALMAITTAVCVPIAQMLIRD